MVVASLMYIEPPAQQLRPGKIKVKRPANPTLENVAEEMINGLFCTYEAPNPAFQKADYIRRTNSTAGILRPPSVALQRTASIRNTASSKSVHWAETLDEFDDAATAATEDDGILETDSDNSSNDGRSSGRNSKNRRSSGRRSSTNTKHRHRDPETERRRQARKSEASDRQLRYAVASSCAEATMEAGCGDGKEDEDCRNYFGTYDEELQTVDSSECGVPQRESRQQRDVVFDENGNPTRSGKSPTLARMLSNPPPPPPPRPPPSRKERFVPELCGVGINCLDDEEQLSELSAANQRQREALLAGHCADDLGALSSSNEEAGSDDSQQQVQVYHRHSSDDVSDEDSIIVENDSKKSKQKGGRRSRKLGLARKSRDQRNRRSSSSSSNNNQRLTKEALERRDRELDKRMNNSMSSSSSSSGSDAGDKKDWENTSNASSFFGLGGRRGGRKSKSQPLSGIPETSGTDVNDPIERQRARDDKKTANAQADQSKNASATVAALGAATYEGPVDLDADGDWDETVPIVPGNRNESSAKNKKRGNSKSPGRGRWSLRGSKRQDAAVDRFSTEADDEKDKIKMIPNINKRDPSPGPFRRRSRSAERNKRTDDGKPPLSFLRRPRSKSPGRKKRSGLNPNDPRMLDRLERDSMIGAHRASYDPEDLSKGTSDGNSTSKASIPPPPPPPLQMNQYCNPYGNPAHPWNQAKQSASNCCDDAMERMSFITAHRQGFEEKEEPQNEKVNNSKSIPSNTPEGQKQAGWDDSVERMSFITAHRSAFDESGSAAMSPKVGLARSLAKQTGEPEPTDGSQSTSDAKSVQTESSGNNQPQLVSAPSGCWPSNGVMGTDPSCMPQAGNYCQLPCPNGVKYLQPVQEASPPPPPPAIPPVSPSMMLKPASPAGSQSRSLATPTSRGRVQTPRSLSRAEKKARKVEKKAVKKAEKEQQRMLKERKKAEKKARRVSDPAAYYIGQSGVPLIVQPSRSFESRSVSPGKRAPANPTLFQNLPPNPQGQYIYIMPPSGFQGNPPNSQQLYSMAPPAGSTKYHLPPQQQQQQQPVNTNPAVNQNGYQGLPESCSSLTSFAHEEEKENVQQEEQPKEQDTAAPEPGQTNEKKSEDLTWEESTRQAWARLRGTFIPATPESKEEEKKDKVDEAPASSSASPLERVTSESSASTTQLRGILKTPSHERRVRFGKDSQRIFTSDPDTVVPPLAQIPGTGMSATQPPPPPPPLDSVPQQVSPSVLGTNATLVQPMSPSQHAAYFAPSTTKKKKVFRGSKMLKDLLRGKKKTKNLEGNQRLGLASARSTDMTFSASRSGSGDEMDMMTSQQYPVFRSPVTNNILHTA